MYLDTESIVTLSALRRAEIERELAGYRQAQRARMGQATLDTPARNGLWQRGLPRWLAAMRGLVPGLARPAAS